MAHGGLMAKVAANNLPLHMDVLFMARCMSFFVRYVEEGGGEAECWPLSFYIYNSKFDQGSCWRGRGSEVLPCQSLSRSQVSSNHLQCCCCHSMRFEPTVAFTLFLWCLCWPVALFFLDKLGSMDSSFFSEIFSLLCQCFDVMLVQQKIFHLDLSIITHLKTVLNNANQQY